MPLSQDELNNQVEEVEWHWLRMHLERGAVIVVSPELDLAEAAAKVAADDSSAVSTWIASGRISKPTMEQIGVWNADPARRFRMLIVQPYVLIQENASEPEKQAD